MTAKPAPKCTVCSRNPARMNSAVAECSHLACPHRRSAWNTPAEYKGPWPTNVDADPVPLGIDLGEPK